MHKVLKAFPCSFDGIRAENLEPGDERDFGSMAAGLKAAGLIGDLKGGGRGELREDGPTIAEYVAAGYLASTYPPAGYASRSAPEEIAVAIEAEKSGGASAEDAARAELGKMTNAQLIDLAKAEDIAVESDNNKATLVDKIIAGRAAKSAATE